MTELSERLGMVVLGEVSIQSNLIQGHYCWRENTGLDELFVCLIAMFLYSL